MKRLLILFALLAISAPAQDPAPAPAAAKPALPAPGRVLLPHGPKWDALPADEKEHIRKMAEFKAARDAAEQELLRLDDEAQARKEAICKENEEAGKLRARISELQAEFAAATNAQRFDIDTPCRTTGCCMNCNSPQSICSYIHFLRNSRGGNRHIVVLVGESLGY